MWSSISLGSLVALAGVGLGIMYVMSPYKVEGYCFLSICERNCCRI